MTDPEEKAADLEKESQPSKEEVQELKENAIKLDKKLNSYLRIAKEKNEQCWRNSGDRDLHLDNLPYGEEVLIIEENLPILKDTIELLKKPVPSYEALSMIEESVQECDIISDLSPITKS